MLKSNFKYLLLLLILADIIYSLVQHFHMPLDGDMACIIMPSDGYKHLMSDPFGISALKGEIYAGTNRFFAHWSMSTYFKIAPFICQTVVNPIDSIYLSSALAKLGIQIFIIWLLSVYITGTWNILQKEFILVTFLVTPLFQSWGFNNYLGIIDKSITYTFFYALPLGLLMLFFLPFYKAISLKEAIKFKPYLIAILIPFSLFLSLNGPLIPAVVLIISPMILLYLFWDFYARSTNQRIISRILQAINSIPKQLVFIIILFCVFCLYSFYIGRFNAENFNKTIPLLDRYLLLSKGLFFQFTRSLGPIMLIGIIVINSVILSRQENPDAKAILRKLNWIGLFALIYILLLPFGGYREYRPFIIRWDTFMPINLCLFYFYGISSLYLINNYKSKLKTAYIAFIIVFLLVFTIADKTDYNASTCEKESLKTIEKSPEKIILLENNCSIMAWGKIRNPNDSKFNCQYIQYIGVLKEEKLYYQK